jgi:hypothetical protein
MSIAIFVWLSSAAPMQAEAPPAAPAQESEHDAALARFKADAATYRISLGGKDSRKLSLLEGPVLRWSNPARNGEDGAVFLWLLDGRPEVIGSLFTFSIRGVERYKHLFHSLSASPVTADYGDLRAWAPAGPGLKFKPVQGGPPVAGQPRLRQVQMRAMAREFSARMVDLKGGAAELRLMPQPLYRYEPEGGEVQDGAIFAFAFDRDPEVLLVLEARGGEDQAQWHYALARFHFVQLWVSHKGQQVWQAEALPRMQYLTMGMRDLLDSPYISFMKPADLP